MNRVRHNRDAIMLLGLTLLIMGFECLRLSLWGGVPMPPETHGSAMYEIPAELWALVVIGQSGAIVWGAWQDSAATVAVAGFFGGLIYLTLFVMADQASLGFLVSRGAAVFGVMNTAAATAGIFDLLTKWLERNVEIALDWVEQQGRMK